MIALIQRVTSASVTVESERIAKINNGLLVFLGVEHGDDKMTAEKLQKKVCGYRIFSDENDKMNLSLLDKAASLLIVPQFTLAASTKKGMRPSFSSAAKPSDGRVLYDFFVDCAASVVDTVETGQFGANMQVELVNDGPVTFWLQVAPTLEQH